MPDSSDWSNSLRVEVRGDDVASHAGRVIPRMLADATEVDSALSVAVSRPEVVHDRARCCVTWRSRSPRAPTASQTRGAGRSAAGVRSGRIDPDDVALAQRDRPRGSGADHRGTQPGTRTRVGVDRRTARAGPAESHLLRRSRCDDRDPHRRVAGRVPFRQGMRGGTSRATMEFTRLRRGATIPGSCWRSSHAAGTRGRTRPPITSRSSTPRSPGYPRGGGATLLVRPASRTRVRASATPTTASRPTAAARVFP